VKIIFRLCALTCALVFILLACVPATPIGSEISGPTFEVGPSAVSSSVTLTPFQPSIGLWMSAAVPAQLRAQTIAVLPNSPLVTLPTEAALVLDIVADDQFTSQWIYALVAPFPTVTDGVTADDVRGAWSGDQTGPFAGRPLWMEQSTLSAFTELWGEPASGAVSVIPADQLIGALWANQPSWGLVPFEALNPQLKVLSVADQSPLHKDFDPAAYPLEINFKLICREPCPINPLPALPATNRDPSKLTTVVMTGVTALVRATAYKMEKEGVDYPARDIRDWLLNADIAHISNEIPFAVGCPYPDPNQTRLIFCSDPKYIDLLDYVGVDVVELTGNHFEDWGREATLNTVAMYRERNWPYYGGGADLADARKPALLERNGMKFAFIGCNPVGPDFAWARADGWPGAAPCDDFQWMIDSIKQLKSQGYIVIATFQYFEYYTPEARPQQLIDFRAMADAGATIVSGSQGHFAQTMEFRNGSFIHYGLGNLFFDQMGYDYADGTRTTKTRHEFLDRHVFYDGKYIGTELLTAMLEDYSRPRPMTPAERADFLTEYFIASGWLAH
jgi:poly-gamma-glutamate synthesis protein (capsule biosynthesis protein)